MNVFLFGAGSSKAYNDSKSGLKLPLSREFFKIYNELDISSNGWIINGDVVNYVRDHRNFEPINFGQFDEDIEVLHSEIQIKYLDAIKEQNNEGIIKYGKAFTQLVFLFCSVINEIQNGTESIFHKRLVESLNDDDIIITFNWDTLIDRALKNNKNWSVQNGYFVEPKLIYADEWKTGIKGDSNILLLKLHGSTNWLSSYINYDFQLGQISFLHDGPQNTFYAYEYSTKPYSCYDGRYLGGYDEFSMGYYPPNLPPTEKEKKIKDGRVLISAILRTGINPKGKSTGEGVISMPIIIPPVKSKSYEFYGDLFIKLWEKAEAVLTKANKIYILGYSFPVTDVLSTNLFKHAFLKRTTMPEVIIINPSPKEIHSKFKYEFGIPENKLKIISENITSDYEICL